MLLTQFCVVGHGSMHQEEEKEGAEHRQTGENEQTKTKERNEMWGYFQHKSYLFSSHWTGTSYGCWLLTLRGRYQWEWTSVAPLAYIRATAFYSTRSGSKRWSGWAHHTKDRKYKPTIVSEFSFDPRSYFIWAEMWQNSVLLKKPCLILCLAI